MQSKSMAGYGFTQVMYKKTDAVFNGLVNIVKKNHCWNLPNNSAGSIYLLAIKDARKVMKP